MSLEKEFEPVTYLLLLSTSVDVSRTQAAQTVALQLIQKHNFCEMESLEKLYLKAQCQRCGEDISFSESTMFCATVAPEDFLTSCCDLFCSTASN